VEGLDKIALKKLNLSEKSIPDLTQWNQFIEKYKNPKHEIKIGLIGKYVELQDSYKSILEAFIHAGALNETKVNVVSIHSEFLDQNTIKQQLEGLQGILVAPGFGGRGIEGKIAAVQYARENKIPFLGICLGMQMAVIEYARNVLNLTDANSTEMNENTSHPVINLMEQQKNITHKGGTMRLGAWKCQVEDNSLAYKIYNTNRISERHRHRYEFNNNYLKTLQQAGLKTSGTNPETGLVEIIEIENHPFFIGVQYHPEYKSTVENPHPLFVHFIKVAVQYNAIMEQ